MRLRNVKNKEEIMNESSYLICNPEDYIGHWNELFHNNNPIYIEIGMGKGQFIINSALNNPNINYIGIEKYDSVIAKALPKIPDGISNLIMIRADALNIDKFFNHEISCIYLNFSDPWPKKRHQLIQYSLVSYSTHGYTLEDVSLDLHNDNMPLITTEYEDKFSGKGMPIYYVKCTKE